MRRRGGSDHPRILSLMSCHRPAVWTVDVIAALPLSSLRSSPTVNESFPVIGQQLDVMSLDTEEAPRTRRKAEASGDSDGGGRGSFPLWPLGPRAPSDSGSLVPCPPASLVTWCTVTLMPGHCWCLAALEHRRGQVAPHGVLITLQYHALDCTPAFPTPGNTFVHLCPSFLQDPAPPRWAGSTIRLHHLTNA